MENSDAESNCCEHFEKFLNRDVGLLILRIAVGGLMLFHGIAKLSKGLDGLKGMMAGRGLPEVMAYGAYVGEILAPILIIIGLATRPAAALVAFTMLTAIYVAHSADIFTLSERGGGLAIELPLLFLLGSLALVFTGSGKLGLRKGRKPLD
ncbi:MAG: DoxX family protein [Chthoniobacterales bacterium]